MSVRGKFGVDVQFTDSTAGVSVQSVKTLGIQHVTEYDFGKVAIVSGTCGTAAVTVPTTPTGYRNAGGDFVSFADGSVSRVAFAASGPNLVRCKGEAGTGVEVQIFSRAGQVAASDCFEEDGALTVRVMGTAGTASFTLIMYGS